MAKYKSRLPHLKSVMIQDPKTSIQKLHNIAPGESIELADDVYAVSSGFKLLVESGQFAKEGSSDKESKAEATPPAPNGAGDGKPEPTPEAESEDESDDAESEEEEGGE